MLPQDDDYFRALVEQSPDLIAALVDAFPAMAYVYDLTTASDVYANQGLERILGYTAEVAQAMGSELFVRLVHPDDLADVLAFQGRIAAAADGEVLVADYRMQHADGRWVHLRSYESPFLRNSDGSLAQKFGVALDVSVHKHAEDALRKSEQRLRHLIESAHDWVWEIDEDGRYVFASPRVVDVLGYEPAEVLGRTPFDFMPPDEAERVASLFTAIAAERESFRDLPNTNVHKAGHLVHLETTGMPILDLDGAYRGYRGLGRDVTERRQADASLRQSESVLKEAQLLAGLGIYVLDVDSGLWTSSEMMDVLFGIDETYERSVGGWLALVHPDDRASMGRYFADQVLGEGKAFDREYRVVRRNDQAVRWVHGLGQLEYDGQGRPVKMLGVIQDITTRREDERERLALERRLQHSQKLESLGVLAGGIAHDFNNILTTVLGNADLALSGLSPSAPARERLLEIIDASQRAAALCRQMLAYSGRGRFVMELIDLEEFIGDIQGLLRSSISKKARLDIHLEKNLPLLECDPSQLSQVIMNLVINASEALGDKEGVITISTEARECSEEYLREAYADEHVAPGRFLCLEVSDTGCGMDADTQARLFEAFFTTKFTGRGLGLAAVLGIMRGHEGALMLTSEPGRGTTFAVLFPASEAQRRPSAHPEKSESFIWQGKGTVLVVDDEETIRNLGSRILRRLGFEVLVAADGLEALEVYREHRDEIILVVLDLTMPRMDGLETFRELCALDPKVRVVMSSGYAEEDVASRFVGKGPAGLLQKPYGIAEVEKCLKAVLSV